jgi:hypothetical protein
MNVIVHQDPSKNSGPGGSSDLPNSRKKMLTVIVVPKDFRLLDAPSHHMVKRSGSV